MAANEPKKRASGVSLLRSAAGSDPLSMLMDTVTEREHDQIDTPQKHDISLDIQELQNNPFSSEYTHNVSSPLSSAQDPDETAVESIEDVPDSIPYIQQLDQDRVPEKITGETMTISLEKAAVQLADGSFVYGSLTVTNYKFIFQPETQYRQRLPHPISVGLAAIARVDKIQTRNQVPPMIEIQSKDLLVVRLSFPDSLPVATDQVAKWLQLYAFPERYEDLFAFSYRLEKDVNGWLIYDPIKELARQGLCFDQNGHSAESPWRLCRLNEDFSLCDTYPRTFVVPSRISDDEVREVARFRTRSRIPTLSWIHPIFQATLWRSSQPKVGVANVCVADQNYLLEISNANEHSNRLFVLDCRPRVNALANRARGNGYETIDFYPNTHVVFANIENIHEIRNSFKRFHSHINTVTNADQQWLYSLESSRWLQNIGTILAACCRVVRAIQERISVLVHCSDGWDRTPQVTSISMIMLDSYYRTIEGFATLVDREWVFFGHRFRTRCGHTSSNSEDSQRSPIFAQFIDCVWQLMEQYPCFFEFNESFLLFILDNLYTCRFGNFLFESEQEHLQYDTIGKTTSIWTAILGPDKHLYLNPFYAQTPVTLFPDSHIRSMKVWFNYYMRQNPRVRFIPNPVEQMNSLMRDALYQIATLEGELMQLRELAVSTKENSEELEEFEEESAIQTRVKRITSNTNPHIAALLKNPVLADSALETIPWVESENKPDSKNFESSEFNLSQNI